MRRHKWKHTSHCDNIADVRFTYGVYGFSKRRVLLQTAYENVISFFLYFYFFASPFTVLMKPKRANIWKTSGLLEPEIDPVKFCVWMQK